MSLSTESMRSCSDFQDSRQETPNLGSKKFSSTGQLNRLASETTRGSGILRRNNQIKDDMNLARKNDYRKFLESLRIKVRKVRFHSCIHLLLIPSRKDFDEKLPGELWYTSQEILSFGRKAHEYFKTHDRSSTEDDDFVEECLPSDASEAEGLLNQKALKIRSLDSDNVTMPNSIINQKIPSVPAYSKLSKNDIFRIGNAAEDYQSDKNAGMGICLGESSPRKIMA